MADREHYGCQPKIWSELPYDLLVLLLAKMTSLIDNVHFGHVCRWWSSARSSAMSVAGLLPSPHPLLMLPSEGNYSTRRFIDLSHESFHRFCMPDLRGRLVVGSSNGWLILKDKDLYTISLINPWSVKHQQNWRLPSLYDLIRGQDYARRHPQSHTKVWKATLSPPPLHIVVALVYGPQQHLAIAGVGEQQWSNVDNGNSSIDDVVYHQNYFFAITTTGNIIVYSVLGRCHVICYKPNLPAIFPLGYDIIRYYLVVIDKDLHVVVKKWFTIMRRNICALYKAKGFRVFKLNAKYPFDTIENGTCQVEEIKSIKGYSLFLGINSSTALKKSSGCKGDCIYFTDDFMPTDARGKDAGVFNMDDGRIQTFPFDLDSTKLCPPIWVTPTPTLLC